MTAAPSTTTLAPTVITTEDEDDVSNIPTLPNQRKGPAGWVIAVIVIVVLLVVAGVVVLIIVLIKRSVSKPHCICIIV